MKIPTLEPSPHWHRQAACKDVPDPDIFYPERGPTGDEAKAICGTCPVRAACLEWALETMSRLGYGARTRRGNGKGPTARRIRAARDGVRGGGGALEHLEIVGLLALPAPL